MLTQELLQSSDPSAELLISADLAEASARALDIAFIDPENAGVADEKPASITNGVTPLVSTGSSLAAIDHDLKAMLAQLVAAGSTLVAATWVMPISVAVALSLLRGSGGAPAYPGVGALGGTLLGLPLITSGNMESVGSPSLTSIVLVDASAIALCDTGASDVFVSKNATIQMLDNPTNNSVTGTATTMVSMFQVSAAAIRATRWINWTLRRSGFVSVLSGVEY